MRTLVFSLLFAIGAASAQEVIPLPVKSEAAAPAASYPEKQYFSKVWNTPVVTNVTKPSLTVYRPLPWMANGVGVIVCPGGGFLALSIESEGSLVAQWLADRGYTAFVLKYRLAHSGDDATAEFVQLWQQDRDKFMKMISTVIPLSISDGLEAVSYVRQHAGTWSLQADKIGIVGFSAGGTVTAGTAFLYTAESRPAFAAPIYGAAAEMRDRPVPADAPPLFVAAATDDSLGLAPESIMLYQKWAAAHKIVELHMYAKGGHGFGMRKQNLPSDEWIARFGDWLKQQGFAKP